MIYPQELFVRPLHLPSGKRLQKTMENHHAIDR